MPENFADRLWQAIRVKRTPACVGFDPAARHLPPEYKARIESAGGTAASVAAAYRDFGRRVLELVAPLVPVVKLNVGFFEPLQGRGLDAYHELVAEARRLGLLVIGDVKRGDIGHTSEAYAQAHLADSVYPDLRAQAGADAVTVNAYLGIDGVQPFLDVARREGKGLFVLVHTSNKSAAQLQVQTLAGGSTVAEQVARLVAEWAAMDGLCGTSGRSAVGAVVAPSDTAVARALRQAMPRSFFLVPGFGAQGRSVEQVAACFHADGSGAIVNSSRGVIFAYEEARYADVGGGVWQKAVESACRDFIAALSAVHTPPNG